jgi:arylsulfatase A-like enzyme
MESLWKRLISCAAILCWLPACGSGPSRPNVILVIVDTLRADHLGAYGYRGGISPVLDAFAARATVFENAISQAPHTIPSVLQIMT